MKRVTGYDAVVIGAGAAGLATAQLLSPLKTLILKKDDESNTIYAQGGIAAAIDPSDSPELHLQDTLLASNLTADQRLAHILTHEASEAISFLKKQGIHFDRKSDNSLALNREGSHSKARVLKIDGDSIGRGLSSTLQKNCSLSSHIDQMSGFVVKDLIIRNNQVAGIVGFDCEWKAIECSRIIVATGGLGQVFARTTNPISSTGDGIAMAKRAGVSLHQMEMIQFHPTALDMNSPQIPLISEALRGAGAFLVNRYGVPIMAKVHPLKDLAPRDIVARTIWKRNEAIYLDATGVREEFPTVKSICEEYGINIEKDPIPVSPAAHYLMGGIFCDEDGRTSLPGLWTVGECAGSGIHGANRLASNSLLECIVFAKRVAESCRSYKNNSLVPMVEVPELLKLAPNQVYEIRKRLQTIMFQSAGLVRDHQTLESALYKIETLTHDIGRNISTHNVRDLIELENLIECSKSICEAALANHKSLGAHYLRNDYESVVTHSL